MAKYVSWEWGGWGGGQEFLWPHLSRREGEVVEVHLVVPIGLNSSMPFILLCSYSCGPSCIMPKIIKSEQICTLFMFIPLAHTHGI